MVLNLVELDFAAMVNQIVVYAQQAIIALIVIAVFFLFSKMVGKYAGLLVHRISKAVRLEEIIFAHGLGDALLGFKLTEIVTIIVELYIMLAFFGTAADLVGLTYFSGIVGTILGYVPNLIEGLAVIVGALFFGDFVSDKIRKRGIFAFKQQAATFVEIFIIYIGVIIALPIVLPAAETTILLDILRLAMMTIVIAVGLGVGLAIGLGFKAPVERAALANQEMFDALIGAVNLKKKRGKNWKNLLE